MTYNLQTLCGMKLSWHCGGYCYYLFTSQILESKEIKVKAQDHAPVIESIPTHSCLIAFHYCSWRSVPPPDQCFCVLHTCTDSLCSLQGPDTGRNRGNLGPADGSGAGAVWSGKASQMHGGSPSVEDLEDVPAGNCCLESQNSTVALSLTLGTEKRDIKQADTWHMKTNRRCRISNRETESWKIEKTKTHIISP